jgi:hypothetical protein
LSERELTIVLADMRLVPDGVAREDDYLWLRFGGDRIAVWTGYEERGEALTVLIANALQNDVSEMQATWGEALPPCPGHAHPLEPDLVEGSAWWVCPGDGRRVARIGRLVIADEQQH